MDFSMLKPVDIAILVGVGILVLILLLPLVIIVAFFGGIGYLVYSAINAPSAPAPTIVVQKSRAPAVIGGSSSGGWQGPYTGREKAASLFDWSSRQCVWCLGVIHPYARACPHCGHEDC